MIIEPAKRLQVVEEYYFSKKLREIAEMKAAGKPVINLGIGSPDLPPSEATINALIEASKKPTIHGYQSYTGVPEFRKALADWYQKYFNVTLNPESEVYPLIGSKEGIFHISMAFLNPGDGVLVPNPGYPTYSSVSRLCEANIVEYNLTEENNWLPDFNELESKDLTNIKLMWVNYPNMPTGTPANLNLFERLIEFGKKHNILIVNDNPYSFVQNPEQLSILQIEGAKDVALELNSLSKSHNMPGWRIGMLAGAADYLTEVRKVKSNQDSGMFYGLQAAATEALNSPDSWYDDINGIYAERRFKVFEIFDILNCKYDISQVGMFIWAKIPDNIESVADFADKILYESNIFITPGFIFGSNGNRYVRISLCADVKIYDETIERLKIAFDK